MGFLKSQLFFDWIVTPIIQILWKLGVNVVLKDEDVTDYSKFKYYYSGKVVRVVDGDTIYVDVDLGFSIYATYKFRFSDIDTPEIFKPKSQEEREHGIQAKSFLSDLILDKDVIIRSHRTGKYGRWVCDIWLEDGTDVQQKLKDNGFEKKVYVI